jgi:hypothetical protein
MTKDTGGFAFPHVIEHLHEPVTAGMELRDYFAAKAMQALISADPMRIYEYVANDAYGYADAMLKARKQ